MSVPINVQFIQKFKKHLLFQYLGFVFFFLIDFFHLLKDFSIYYIILIILFYQYVLVFYISTLIFCQGHELVP